jgi:N-acetylated-alpha-linked acidic dipeptidase
MDLRIKRLLVAASLALYAAGVAVSAQQTPVAVSAMLGFTASDAAAERALEQRFDAGLDASNLREWLQRLSSGPNQVGSPHDKANAEFMLQLFRDWGWEAHIETFQVLYPTPKRVALQLLAPHPFTATLREPPVAGDATSNLPGTLPPYNAYSADGDVSGELVYVNHGMPEDYRELARRGIDVRGRIVIVRYGGGWRGLKPKLAHEHGAIGCIIYSDPADDGYNPGDVYPAGAWRPAQGVQRGSVADITLYPGDPLTPGVGATADARRLSRAEATTLMAIPVLPISYGDAQPLLAALSGPVAPPSWRGALPITYHVGPGAAKVRLQIASDWSLKPVYDVIARISGSELPDEWVVRGNHHDGWVFGAWDPIAGTVALMAEAKSIGALVRAGWRPRRTLVFGSWDGEEPGLIGSTEWAEEHAQELAQHAVLYINSDSNTRGFLDAGGSHALERLLNEVGADVHDPETGGSVLERLRARIRVDAYGGDEDSRKLAGAAASGADVPLTALGSGSDYTPFLQHLGIATLSVEYGGEGEDRGIYHSKYDSFDHYIRFSDPNFAYGIAEAQTIGRLVLRSADADVLPLQFDDLAQTVGGYVQELHTLLEQKRTHAQSLAALREARAFELANDPKQPVGPPESESEVPFLNLSALDNGLERLTHSAHAYDQAYQGAISRGLGLSASQRAQLDQALRGLEQTLTNDVGLPGRPWYRHLLYAPGLLTGYGAKTLPGVREAIEQARWSEAERYAALTGAALEAYAARLDTATALLGH